MNLISLIAIGIVAMLLLALGIIFFVVLYQRRVIRHQHEIKKIQELKQQELINASIQGEEQERMRIASELHDDVGATLSSVRLFLHSASRHPEDPDIIHQSKELLDDSIQKIRDLSHQLQPATLQRLGLQISLESHADIINRAGNVRMQYSCEKELPRLDENTEMSIYRVVQELTNNILKHANASMIRLETNVTPLLLTVGLVHNGDGLTNEQYQELIYKKGAIGLKNIVNRVQSIGADINFAHTDDHIYEIAISIPLKG